MVRMLVGNLVKVGKREMTVAELNSCLAKARMGFTSLKMCLDSATDIMQQKSGAAREHDFQLSIIYCCN